MLYRAKRPVAGAMSKEAEPSGKASGESMHVLGPNDAPVTLEEFGDFQCPPCAKLSDPINQLQRDYGSRLRVIFHHFPLATHQHAREAACAAEAAHMQGRFWQMHDLLYREQPVWSKAADVQSLFSSYAGILGLRVERFKQDMESEKVRARVDSDQKHGASIGVQNTPTLFLNNQALPPTNLSPEAVRAAVDAAVKSAKPSS
jgi:protein-disulfide isomerase